MDKKKASSHKDIFNKEYFTGYYFDLTGNFTKADLKRNKNWFHGWFDALQELYDFKNGKGRKVLEFGCAIGAAASILADRGFDVLATDISTYALNKAKKILPNLKFRLMDIEKFTPSLREEFDLIYSFEVVEHLNNPEEAFKNIHQMLKPGGVVICSTPYPYKHIFRDKTHINIKYPDEWVSLLKKIGYKNIKYKRKSFVPFFYRFSKHFHIKFTVGIPTRFINSTVFLYAEKK